MRPFFQDRGTLPHDAPSYVERPADEELLQLCREGRLCYVLAPRQTGKSSLVVRTRRRLEDAGVLSVYIDLTSVGAEDVTPEQWYLSLLAEIQEQLGLGVELESWWEERRHLTVVKRLSDFLQNEVLPQVEGGVVVFVDEIDSTLKLPFSADDFFAALRALHNARAMEPALERLSFVLLGVASPSELIRDPQRTPFNVGEAVELDDLELREGMAEALLAGLEGTGDPLAVLERVFYWTDGHPRLTQRLCQGVTERPRRTPEDVDSIADETFLGAQGEQDETLREIRRQADRDPRAQKWLPIYLRILRGHEPKVDAESEEQTRLLLVGLVKGRPGQRLRTRNRIFSRVFDVNWARRLLRRDPVRRWAVLATAATVLLALAVSTVFVLQVRERRAEKKMLFEQLALDDPGVSLGALDRLLTVHDVSPEEIRRILRGLPASQLAELFTRGPAGLLPRRRPGAVLQAVELTLPLVGTATEDLILIGAMAWSIDYFAAREAGLSKRALEVREALLEPLRKARPPPAMAESDWAVIPAGSFRMGSDPDEKLPYEPDPDEFPPHQVELSAFRMLNHEVTNEEFRHLVPSRGGADDLPAVRVDWYTAYAYAAWLGGRLPTEAEWEYAARAGCPHPYCDRHGNKTTLDEVGWYAGNSDIELHPVMRLEPNPWGLFDLYGNVWEWVADWYGSYPDDLQSDPWGPPSGGNRVFRGGGFWSVAQGARAAFRFRRNPEIVNDDLGFRVVLPAAPSD